MNYGIILGGNQTYSEKIFKIQKRMIRIITNLISTDSCRELLKKLGILLLYSQFFFATIFLIKNEHLFCTNIQVVLFCSLLWPMSTT